MKSLVYDYSVCLIIYCVKAGLISLLSSTGIKQRIFLVNVYKKSLTRTICATGFEQIAKVINYHVCLAFIALVNITLSG